MVFKTLMTLIKLLMSLTLTLHIAHNHSGGVCTAVWISPTEAITASHCVESPKDKLFVKDELNRSFTATLERQDDQVDLALIKIQSPKHKYVKMGKPLIRGDKVYVMHSGNDFSNTYGEGIVANIILDPINYALTLLHSAPIVPGASGSGLFNEKGELVGINTAMYKALSSAVDITEVHLFLTGQHR
jgi:serine protease Do